MPQQLLPVFMGNTQVMVTYRKYRKLWRIGFHHQRTAGMLKKILKLPAGIKGISIIGKTHGSKLS